MKVLRKQSSSTYKSSDFRRFFEFQRLAETQSSVNLYLRRTLYYVVQFSFLLLLDRRAWIWRNWTVSLERLRESICVFQFSWVLHYGTSSDHRTRIQSKWNPPTIHSWRQTHRSNEVRLKPVLDWSPVSYGLFLGDTTRPPRSLLEASSRRVAKHIEENLRLKKEETKSSGQNICKSFTEAYTKALREANLKWASEQNVTELFHKEAKLITHDKQTHVGLTAIIRRLNTGTTSFLQHI